MSGCTLLAENNSSKVEAVSKAGPVSMILNMNHYIKKNKITVKMNYK